MTYRFALRRIALWLVPIMALSAVGFAAGHKPDVEPGLQVAKTGIVIDAQTRRPLAGVFVVARWLEQSHDAAQIGGQCLFRTVARTDDEGRYTIPAAAVTIPSDRTLAERKYYWDVSAYLPGYSAVDQGMAHPRIGNSPVPATQALEPVMLAGDYAAPEKRVAALIDTLDRFTCSGYSNAPVPIAQQLYTEAYAAACLPEPNDAARLLAHLRSDLHAAHEPCAELRQASLAR
jgi:hypothetical protein